METRKIGIISGGRQIGGAEVTCVQFAAWLKTRGANVWLHVGTGGEDQLSGQVAGVESYYGVRVVDGLREAKNADVIWLYGTKLLGQHKWLAERINPAKKIFAFVGGFNPDYADPHWLRVDRYWCESENVAHYLKKCLKVPAKKIVVCRVPTLVDKPVKPSRPFPDKFTFGVVARLYSRKRSVDAILALNALDRQDCALFVVGDGPRHRMMRRTVEKFPNLTVRFTRWALKRKRYLQYLKGLNCLVSASQWEGCSCTMREAMVLGVPVIGTAGYYKASDGTRWPGGTPELIKHGETGLLRPLGDFDALVDCMKQMADGAAGRERMAKAARRFMEESNRVHGKLALELLGL